MLAFSSSSRREKRMLLRPAATLPRGDQWLYELEFDGFRVGFKGGEEFRFAAKLEVYLRG
jgi:ATP-dependent DNA ligase